MRLPEGNPQPPEHINNPSQRPVMEFLGLLVVTGLVLAALLAVLVLLAERLSPHIPLSWELSATESLFPGEDPDERTRALHALATALARHAGVDERLPVRVHYLDVPEPNAFASLGGHIFVTRGLLENVSSENALAMVLAHEIAHLHYRDPAAMLSRQAVISLVWAAFTGDAGGGVFQQALFQTGTLTALSFDRDMERRADRFATDTLQSYYGHTGGADEFFQRLQAHRHEPAWSAVFRSHPLTSERLARLAQDALPEDQVLIPLPPALRAQKP